LRQCREEGRAVSPSWVRAANRLTALDADALCEPANQAKAGALLDESQRFSVRRDISEVLANHAAGMDYDSAAGWVHARWNEKDQHDWCHTNSNAAIVALGLLYGDGDFGTSICRAVQPCFDTDCNGATVGSILGMRLGAGGIPGAWTQRLADSIQTMQMHFEKAKISAMAERTYEVYRRL
jgi:hypothetical protein